jgi:hypothetical protein
MPLVGPLDREHGTDRGYYQHMNYGEYACDPCKDRHSIEVTVSRRPPELRAEFARLVALNVNPRAALVLTQVRVDPERAPRWRGGVRAVHPLAVSA